MIEAALLPAILNWYSKKSFLYSESIFEYTKAADMAVFVCVITLLKFFAFEAAEWL